MFRSVIRYVILTFVVIGIVLLFASLVGNKENNKFNSDNGSNSKYYTASIRVLDKESKKFINGGEFILKNSSDKIIDEWNNSENIHRVTKLKNGTYVIEQVSAIDGYSMTDEVIFKISGSDKNVVVYNEVSEEKEVIGSSEVSVDNTLSVKCFLSYLLAIVTILCGLALVLNKKVRV